MKGAMGRSISKHVATIKAGEDLIPSSPVLEFPLSRALQFLAIVANIHTPKQTLHITMVAFALLRASIALIGLLAPGTLGAPAPSKTVLTPAGYRPAENVHVVPEGRP